MDKTEKIKTILFLITIVLLFIGFFIGNSDKIPLVNSILNPSYANAQKGLEILQSKKELISSDLGFFEIERICRNKIQESGRSDLFESQKLEKFIYPEEVKFGSFGVRRTVQVKFTTTTVTDWDVDSIKQGIESIKTKNMLEIGFICFIATLLLLVSNHFLPSIYELDTNPQKVDSNS